MVEPLYKAGKMVWLKELDDLPACKFLIVNVDLTNKSYHGMAFFEFDRETNTFQAFEPSANKEGVYAELEWDQVYGETKP